MQSRQILRRSLLFSFLLLFPITFNYYSPYLPIEGTVNRVVTFSLLFWVAWWLASLALGRAACGYICPLGGLQEIWDWATGRRLRRVKYVAILKYLIWALWIGAIVFAAVSHGGWERIDLLYNTESGISWDSADRVMIYAGMFGLVLLLCLPLGRRAFCHYLCWWAPLNISGSKLAEATGTPHLQLAAAQERCVHCHTCTKGCPMSLPVEDMIAEGAMQQTECILCGTCVDNCRSGAISYSWRRRGGAG